MNILSGLRHSLTLNFEFDSAWKTPFAPVKFLNMHEKVCQHIILIRSLTIGQGKI